jgi:hypothetical protein
MLPVNLFAFVICPVYDIIHEIVMVANIYETNLYNVCMTIQFLNNVSILLAWLSAAGKEVVLYLVARNTL